MLFSHFFYICIVKKRYFILTLVSLLLLSCGRRTEEAVVEPTPLPFTVSDTLLRIDTLMQSCPDSALMCIMSFRPERNAMERSGEISYTFNESYRDLLLSEALYKTDNLQLNRFVGVETYGRTSLHEAIDYFDSLYAGYPQNDNLAMLSARSHYMHGVGYYENDSVVDACKEYLRTLEIMENHFDTEKLTGYKAKFLGLTYTRLGQVFYANDVAQASLKTFKKALHYYNNADNYNLANPFRNIAGSYSLNHQPDSALLYYRKARLIAKTTNKAFVYGATLSESAPIYYDLGLIDSAFVMIQEALSLPCSEDARLARYYTLGSLYEKENRYDSAIVYLEQSVKRNSYETQTASADLLMNCYQALGDTIKADYYKSIYGSNFSTYRNNSEITTELTKLYDDYQQQQADMDNLLKRRHQNRIYYIVLSVVILLIAGIIISRIKVRRTIIKSNYDLAIKNKALADMKRKMEANPFINEPICNFIWKVVAENSFKAKIDFREYKDNALDKNQIIMLRDAVDRHYDNFTQTLGKQYPELTVDDIDYCCLYLLGLKDADISALIQRAYPTVHQRSNKLKHIFNTKESLQTTIADMASKLQFEK